MVRLAQRALGPAQGRVCAVQLLQPWSVIVYVHVLTVLSIV